jgi:hypothetical protein
MTDTPNLLVDRNLEAATIISLRREPACFAFLSASAVSAPIPIDSLNLDLASVDYYGGRSSFAGRISMRKAARVVAASMSERVKGLRKLSSKPRTAVGSSLVAPERISSVAQSEARPP